MIELAQEEKEREQHVPVASIKVVGVGGAGGNTINCMVQSDYTGVEFFAVNTDAQTLKKSKAHKALQIGQKSTKGLGAGANPDVGKRAAEEDLDKVLSELHNADIVFLVGGMGGGTGSGALPVITQALKEKGILTVVVVTKPFEFEGRRRLAVANRAIEKIKEFADTLLVVPNQKLLDVVDDQVSMTEGFDMINQEVLNQSVKGVSDIITKTGHINVDFADVREIMKDQGLAVMGTGRASGEDRARKAALAAISSPLLENMSIAGAQGVLLNVSGSSNLGLHEISAAASVIYDQVDPDANIILGSVVDESLGDEVSITVIATGFNEHPDADLKVRATVLAPEARKQEERAPAQEQQMAPDEESGIKEASEELEDAEEMEFQEADVAPEQRHHQQPRQEQSCQEQPRQNQEQQANSGLGSNVIQVKDLDVPTFMRKQNNQQQHHGKHHKKYKKNKHKYHQQQQQHQRHGHEE